MDEHSSLLQTFVNYAINIFIELAPGHCESGNWGSQLLCEVFIDI